MRLKGEMGVRQSGFQVVAALLAIVAAASIIACAPEHPPAAAEDAAGSRSLPAEVDVYVARAMDWYGIPALSVAIVSRGEVVHAASYGVADLPSGVPATNATLYQLSSTAKIFAASAFMTLVEDGLVALDAPVGTHLPEAPEAWRHVTVRQLLAHLSGLPDIVACDRLPEGEAVECALKLGEPDPPGERFAYNQTNYYLVQKILERTTGSSLPDFVARRTFASLGITGALYAGESSETIPGRASSYYPDGDGGVQPREYSFPPYLFAAAGLNASLDAVVTWVRALEAGRLLRPETVAEMWREPTLNDGSVSSYALGWDLKTHAPGHRSAGHSGGRLTAVRIFMQDSLAVVVLANGSAMRIDPDAIAEELAALIVPEVQAPGDRLASEMRAALADSGIGAALELHARFASDPSRMDDSVEDAMNSLGYELLGRRQTGDAVDVLRVTAESFPDSWNAHDSLGEAYLAHGNVEAARAEYERSLELNPENENAWEVLRGLSE